ncbi:MAG TPA: response regulator [Polyangia bacterium]|nr:response regulator [Polyangia bacterium]
MGTDDKKRVLVVDADPGARRLIGKVVELEDAEPILVGSGEEALDLLEIHSYDLLLAARDLPGINGLELIRVARAIRPGMPVLLVTDCSAVEDARRAAALGIVDQILKPVIVEELRASLQRAFTRDSRDRDGIAPGRIVIEPATSTAASRQPDVPSGREETRVFRRSSGPPARESGRLSVLVIEPDVTSRAALTDLFALLGHDVVAFASAARAEGQVVHAGFDLLVAPPETLRERPEWLREAGDRRPLGAMAIMDGAGIDKTIEAIQLGARGVVTPPFDRDRVSRALGIALARMREEAEPGDG